MGLSAATPPPWKITATAALVRLDWLESGGEMGRAEFRAALLAVTDRLEEQRARALLIDLTCLAYRPDGDDIAWRAADIAPRWNRAGLARLAYVTGAPGGGVPAPRPGEDFLTRFCADETDALAWLAAP